MRIVSVVGARPQFVKLAPIDHAIRRLGVHEHLIVHTGQHYDPQLSDVFFAELDIAKPAVHLGVGSGSHAEQTAAMLPGLEAELLAMKPDWVLVYGDTNSTIAAALAAVKVHLPVAHLEAGLRSHNRAMPEEVNRVLTDHAADRLLAPTQSAARQLEAEGLASRTTVVGDVMTDVCLQTKDAVAEATNPLAGTVDTDADYFVATIHRAENTDDENRLRSVMGALQSLPVPVVLLVHPRLSARSSQFGIAVETGSLKTHAPLGYPELVRAVMGARGVLTDSGGLQKEAMLLETPCTTIRAETEWTETVDAGWNVLAPDPEEIPAAALRSAPLGAPPQPYGDGQAAEAVIAALEAPIDGKVARAT